MLGTLLLVAFLIQQGHSSLLRLQLALISDNQGNVYALLNQQTRNMPTAAFLMQLVSLLYDRGSQLAPSHCKRDRNQWADGLTHPDPVGFTPERRLSLAPVCESFTLLPQILPEWKIPTLWPAQGGNEVEAFLFSTHPRSLGESGCGCICSVWGGWNFGWRHLTGYIVPVHVEDQVWISHADQQQPHRQHLSSEKGFACWRVLLLLHKHIDSTFMIRAIFDWYGNTYTHTYIYIYIYIFTLYTSIHILYLNGLSLIIKAESCAIFVRLVISARPHRILHRFAACLSTERVSTEQATGFGVLFGALDMEKIISTSRTHFIVDFGPHNWQLTYVHLSSDYRVATRVAKTNVDSMVMH